jgi:ElaB/YqjD/DUF883 family membrane-anchored ribosome-binding protein
MRIRSKVAQDRRWQLTVRMPPLPARHRRPVRLEMMHVGRAAPGETVSSLSGQAREAAGRMGASVSDAAGRAGQTLSEQGSRAADQSAALVREQPFMALALTGAACLIIGILLGRR